MKLDLLHQPDSAIAKVTMAPREELVAEARAMIAMSEYINVSTTLRRGKGGGVLGGLKRMLAGESLFLSVFRSGDEEAEIYLAPKLMGDILPYQLKGIELVVQSTNGAKDFFVALMEKEGLDLAILSSHPTSEKRIERIETIIQRKQYRIGERLPLPSSLGKE